MQLRNLGGLAPLPLLFDMGAETQNGTRRFPGWILPNICGWRRRRVPGWGLDECYRDIKEDGFGKFPYAGGGWGLALAEHVPRVPSWDILPSIAAGERSKASSSLPAATDAIKPY